jgi:hypothetical protein
MTQAGEILAITLEGTLAGHGYINLGEQVKNKQRLESVLTCTNFPKRYATQVHIGKGISSTGILVDFYIIAFISFWFNS